MRTSFGRLVSDLSTRFTGLPVEEVDGEIERALHLLVELLGTDRGTCLRLLAVLVQTKSSLEGLLVERIRFRFHSGGVDTVATLES